MIISVSRRTDIPTFYSEWFMNRVQEGFVLIRNPYNTHQIKKVSLLEQDVDGIVFWTRNAEKLIPHFHILDSKGYKYYFQYTITGYPRALEKGVPKTLQAIKTFHKISDLIGNGRIVWRYDPILISNLVDIDEHKRLFEKIASMLQGKTKRVVISFADIYKKVKTNLSLVENLHYADLISNNSNLLELSKFMSNIATKYQMEIQSCSEEINLSSVGILHGKCVDDNLFKSEFGITLSNKKDKGQREECGCIESVDIGQYNTCLHGCEYCYATFNKKVAVKNNLLHNPKSSFLIGELEKDEILPRNLDKKEDKQMSIDF
ncbi:MAG: DUF1848 domain-containing protein [Proteobacteria bacterium]|nr:DUF1848 domain-containing protein [Pseudomonadota bacterium]